jgi:hypothetical protein
MPHWECRLCPSEGDHPTSGYDGWNEHYRAAHEAAAEAQAARIVADRDALIRIARSRGEVYTYQPPYMRERNPDEPPDGTSTPTPEIVPVELADEPINRPSHSAATVSAPARDPFALT